MEYYSQLTNCFNSIHYDFLIVKKIIIKKSPFININIHKYLQS
jgi:hypothetical protein